MAGSGAVLLPNATATGTTARLTPTATTTVGGAFYLLATTTLTLTAALNTALEPAVGGLNVTGLGAATALSSAGTLVVTSGCTLQLTALTQLVGSFSLPGAGSVMRLRGSIAMLTATTVTIAAQTGSVLDLQSAALSLAGTAVWTFAGSSGVVLSGTATPVALGTTARWTFVGAVALDTTLSFSGAVGNNVDLVGAVKQMIDGSLVSCLYLIACVVSDH